MVKWILSGVSEMLMWWALGTIMASFPFGLLALLGWAVFESNDGLWFWLGAGVLYGVAMWMSCDNRRL